MSTRRLVRLRLMARAPRRGEGKTPVAGVAAGDDEAWMIYGAAVELEETEPSARDDGAAVASEETKLSARDDGAVVESTS